MKQLSIFSNIPAPELKTNNKWEIYVDGASRNNPGLSGAGIYLLKNGESVLKKGFFLGIKTNNQAEYIALVLGLILAKELIKEGERLVIKSDSKLLINQILGLYKIKNPDLKKLNVIIKKMLDGLDYSCIHILRESNSVADMLANNGIDKKIDIPSNILYEWQKYEKSV